MSAALKPTFSKYDLWARFRYFCMHTLLHADDTPHRIALGAAVGIWFALTPTVGIQIITIIPLAAIIRCNKAVALAMIWISNPITTVPIYLGGYWIGAKMLGYEFKMKLIYEMVGRTYDETWFGAPNDLSLWENIIQGTQIAFGEIMWPLWFGCLIVGTLTAVPSYFLLNKLISYHRNKKYGSVNIRAVTKGIVIDEKEILLRNGKRVPWDAENECPILEDKDQDTKDADDSTDPDGSESLANEDPDAETSTNELKLQGTDNNKSSSSDNSVFAA